MGASFSAEALKLRKRPATWVLGIIWIAAIVLLAYFLTYAFLSVPPQVPPDAPAGTEQQAQAVQEEQLQLLYPESFVSNVISGFSNIGGPIALILGALAIGSEYSWGTLKTILTQRPSRLGAFFGKLLALGVVVVALTVLAFVAAAVCSYIIAGLQDASVNWPAASRVFSGFGAGALILAAWALFGLFLATLFRSTALAIGIGLVYALVLEGILFSLPIQNDTLDNAREYLLGQNTTFLANSFTDNLPQGFGSQPPPVDATHAALVIGGYAVVFAVISVILFRQRDMA